MNPLELSKALETIGLPVAYNLFKQKQTKDYLIYTYSASISGSDEGSELIEYSYTIELYKRDEDVSVENKILDLLTGVNVEQSETIYIESEKRFMTAFSFSSLTIKED
ncbi:hypothetical protein [Dielma fastidiosa]|uniref:hypothetical protein n=1 Tax=Dielma fastidiosa TaxID=1034346 RepID=UPI003564465F